MTYVIDLEFATHRIREKHMLFGGIVTYLSGYSAVFTAEFDLVGHVWKTQVAGGNNEYIFSAIVAACAPHIPGEQA